MEQICQNCKSWKGRDKWWNKCENIEVITSFGDYQHNCYDTFYDFGCKYFELKMPESESFMDSHC